MSDDFPIKLFEGQINFVKFLKFHPCAEPFPILIETFFPCVLKMAIDLYLLDAQDVAMREFEKYPRYGRGVAARRTLRHQLKKIKNQKYVSRRVAVPVPFIERPAIKGLTTAIFWIANPLEKIGFAMLFYSSVDNFFYNWTSLLIRRGYCELPALTGPLSLRSNPGNQVFVTSGEPCAMPVEIQNRASWSHNSFSCSLPPGDYTATFRMTVKNNFSSTVGGVRLVIKEGTYPLPLARHESETVYVGPGQTVEIGVAAGVGSPTFVVNSLWWECESVGVPIAQLEQLSANFIVWQNYEEISF